MASTRLVTVGEGDDRIEFWKPLFDGLFKELWAGVARARQGGLDLPWEDIIAPETATAESQKGLVEALRNAEIDFEHDAVFEALSPGACIEGEEWDSGGPMSGVYKARIPSSEKREAIKVLESVASSLRHFWTTREG
jgi:hypothetical protein